MTLNEDALTDWLVDYLEDDTELMNLASGVAPEVRWGSLRSPFIRVDRIDGEDLMVVGLERVWTDTVYHVRGVEHYQGGDRPDRSTVNAIGERIDELLHDVEVQTSTHSIHGFREEPEPVPASVEPNGELWLQSGGLYRLRVYPV